MSVRDRLRDQGDPVEIEVVTASSVTPENVPWLWRGWIPLAMQSALVGLPGPGKTTLAVRISAGVTRGSLAGDLEGTPADVLFISYEDAIKYRLRPMAEAAEADLDRIHFVKAKLTGHLIDLTSHLPRIEELAREHNAKLLVIDPLVAGMPAGKIDAHRDNAVRSVLAPIYGLAEELVLAVLSTGHFAKHALSALLGTGGSIGFVGAPRSILAFGPDPRDGAAEGARVLAHAKSNVGRMQASLEVRILEDWLDPFGDNPVVTSRAELGDECEVTADDLVQVRTESPREKATRFLLELLTDGRHKAEEVYELAARACISKKTLKRAKKDLGVKSDQEGRVWWWRLPTGDELEGEGEDE